MKALAISLFAVATLTGAAAAQDVPQLPSSQTPAVAARPNIVRGDEITPAQQRSVEKGLQWLADHQGADGSFGGGGQGKHAGITALAGLAFMEAGNLPGRGKYADNVSRCLKFVLDSCQESGLIAS